MQVMTEGSTDDNQASCKAQPGVASSEEILEQKLKEVEVTPKHERTNKILKVFTVMGHYPLVRESLLKRGWVEKISPGKGRPSNASAPAPTTPKKQPAASPSRKCPLDGSPKHLTPTKSRRTSTTSVKHLMPTFVWTYSRDSLVFHNLHPQQIVNFHPHVTFNTKYGLVTCLEDLVWYEQRNSFDFFPRCYTINDPHQRTEFIQDYRLMCAMGILRWVVDHFPVDDEGQTVTDKPVMPNLSYGGAAPSSGFSNRSHRGTFSLVPGSCVTMALRVCGEYLCVAHHQDIDRKVQRQWYDEEEWRHLQEWSYALSHKNAMVVDCRDKVSECWRVLDELANVVPQAEMDDVVGAGTNVWIVKPGARSRGRGIVLMDRLEDILKMVDDKSSAREFNYVVQKYIERPLLIFETKFDIRQWFMVTDWNPLVVWFYKDSYVRFCSRKYNLDDKNEAVHLSNNAIQKFFIGRGPEHEDVPAEFMWTSDELQEYLASHRDNPVAWSSAIYPGMKRAIISAMLVAQESAECRKNSFELYGADFVLTEDFKPWLIEINSSPCLALNTAVKIKLCNSLFDDIIKVVLDGRFNKSSDTGRFELIYHQPTMTLPPYIGMKLCVMGRPITVHPYIVNSNSCKILSLDPSSIIPREKLAAKRCAKFKHSSTGQGLAMPARLVHFYEQSARRPKSQRKRSGLANSNSSNISKQTTDKLREKNEMEESNSSHQFSGAKKIQRKRFPRKVVPHKSSQITQVKQGIHIFQANGSKRIKRKKAIKQQPKDL